MPRCSDLTIFVLTDGQNRLLYPLRMCAGYSGRGNNCYGLEMGKFQGAPDMVCPMTMEDYKHNIKLLVTLDKTRSLY
jgi:hypothetical protein